MNRAELAARPTGRSVTPDFERGVALAIVVLVGMRLEVMYSISVGSMVALALLPVWVRFVPSFSGAATVLGLIPVAVVSGGVLTLVHQVDHPVFLNLLVSRSAMLVGLAGAVGALLWCRRLWGTQAMTLAFGTGMILGIPFNISDNPNQWRFTYTIPVTILLLALVSRWNRPSQVVVALALGVTGALSDSRSNTGMLVLAAVVIIWQSAARGHRRGWGSAALLAAWGTAVYLLVRYLILGGYFGEAALQRTQLQIDQGGGSLLLGGRPEAAASAELVSSYPWGMGSGAGAAYRDIVAAKAAMFDIGYNANNGYVENYMFGRGIEVHSAIGDYWLWFGLAGVALCATFLWIVLTGVLRLYRDDALTVLHAFLVTRFLWDLGFSPAVSGLSLLALTLALFMRPDRDVGPGHVEDPPTGSGGQRLGWQDRRPANNAGTRGLPSLR